VPHFEKPGIPDTRSLVVELCESFYHLGWVTGTGGSISIRHGNRIFMAPSSVQKERMQPQDIFVLDTRGQQLYIPRPLAGKPQLKLSQCAPLFQHAFTLRTAGACIHTHDVNAVLCTLQNDTEWRITHQEMIKGIAGHGFLDELVVPIIENTPHECDLADSLEEAMRKYPRSNAVLVRRHGVYVWGSSWEMAKTQAECYHYLFDASVKMRAIGVDPAAKPDRVTHGIGANTSYGTDLAGSGGKKRRGDESVVVDACCKGGAAHVHPPAVPVETSAGFHGSQGTNAANASTEATAPLVIQPLNPSGASHVLLDIEGATTSLAFVTDVLFPFAAKHVKEHLERHWGSAEVAEDVAALQAQSKLDVSGGLTGATLNAVTLEHVAAASAGTAAAATIDAIVSNVLWQMESNRKTGALKQLQGHVWRSGYENGQLKSQVFPDVPVALERWTSDKKKVYIYSSGSREAQRLLFAYTGYGDLRPFLSGYFDTKVGAKVEANSYKDIVLSLGVDSPSNILFATDSLLEARAAAAAGLQVAVTDRPGNLPLAAGHGFPVVTSFSELI
jgi:methylthioribulose 1-phosphate dehydratase/enolase-phosphatase E1